MVKRILMSTPRIYRSAVKFSTRSFRHQFLTFWQRACTCDWCCQLHDSCHLVVCLDSGHNGHKPKRPKPKRPQTETATNRNGHRPKRPQTETATNRNGHKPKRPQTETATDRNGHKPKRPQTGTATNRNGYKPKRPQTGTATIRNRHNYIWFSGLQMYVLNRSFKLVSRSRQK